MFKYTLALIEKCFAADADTWITVKPNGEEHTGRHVKIDGETGVIKAGMGGKFNGQKISEARSSFTGPRITSNLRKSKATKLAKGAVKSPATKKKKSSEISKETQKKTGDIFTKLKEFYKKNASNKDLEYIDSFIRNYKGNIEIFNEISKMAGRNLAEVPTSEFTNQEKECMFDLACYDTYRLGTERFVIKDGQVFYKSGSNLTPSIYSEAKKEFKKKSLSIKKSLKNDFNIVVSDDFNEGDYAAILRYPDLYGTANFIMRSIPDDILESGPQFKPYKVATEMISGALDKIKPYEGSEVLRGIKLPPEQYSSFLKENAKGNVITLNAITSATTDYEVAKKYSSASSTDGSIIMHINGKSGRNVSGLIGLNQILFKPGTKLAVKNIEKDEDGILHIHYDEVK